MLEGILTGGAVGKSYSNDVRCAECAGREKRGYSRIDSAGNPNHAFLEAPQAEFLSQERCEPVRGESGIDVQRRRANDTWRRGDNLDTPATFHPRRFCPLRRWWL